MLEKDKFNRDTQRELTSSHSAKEKKICHWKSSTKWSLDFVPFTYELEFHVCGLLFFVRSTLFFILLLLFFFCLLILRAIREVLFVCVLWKKSSFIAFVPRNSILIGIGSDAGAQLWRCRHISFALLSLSLSLSNTTPRRWGTIYTAHYNTYTWNNTSKYIGTGREICISDEACIHYPRSQKRARLKNIIYHFFGLPKLLCGFFILFCLFFVYRRDVVGWCPSCSPSFCCNPTCAVHSFGGPMIHMLQRAPAPFGKTVSVYPGFGVQCMECCWSIAPNGLLRATSTPACLLVAPILCFPSYISLKTSSRKKENNKVQN